MDIDPNRFFHLGKNRNRSNRFIAMYLRFFAILQFFLGNHIRHREKTEEDCKDEQTKRSTAFNGSMVSILGTVESSK